MAEPICLGQVMAFAGNFNPRSWQYCNGSLQSIASSSTMYSLLGTNYGGDGRSTFGLPDLRGRSPLGEGAGPGLMSRRLGQQGGSESVVLDVRDMPSHNHTVIAQISGSVTAAANCYTGTQSIVSSPDSAVPAQQGLQVPNDSKAYSRSTPNAAMSDEFITTENNLEVSVANNNTGGGQDHNNMHPFTCLNFVIAIDGVYPSRS